MDLDIRQADGLLVAPTTSFAFTQTSTIHVQCLVTRGTDLWACSDEVSGFVAGVSQNDGKTFTPVLHLLGIEGPVQCPAKSTAAQCTSWDLEAGASYNPYVGLCSNLGACYPSPPDSGPVPLSSSCICTGACNAAASSVASDYDASVTCDAGSGPSPKSSGGCSAVGGRGAAGAFAGGTVLAIAVLASRRRRAKARGGSR